MRVLQSRYTYLTIHFGIHATPSRNLLFEFFAQDYIGFVSFIQIWEFGVYGCSVKVKEWWQKISYFWARPSKKYPTPVKVTFLKIMKINFFTRRNDWKTASSSSGLSSVLFPQSFASNFYLALLKLTKSYQKISFCTKLSLQHVHLYPQGDGCISFCKTSGRFLLVLQLVAGEHALLSARFNEYNLGAYCH